MDSLKPTGFTRSNRPKALLEEKSPKFSRHLINFLRHGRGPAKTIKEHNQLPPDQRTEVRLLNSSLYIDISPSKLMND